MKKQTGSSPAEKSQAVVHRAPWVVVDGSSVLVDGGVAVADGLILAVGGYSDLQKEYDAYPLIEHEQKILTPALINSHCHLELSHLETVSRTGSREPYQGDITAWIRDLLLERDSFLMNDNAKERIYSCAGDTLRRMHDEGVAFVGDTGNSLESMSIGNGHETEVFFLLELLGLTNESETASLVRLDQVQSEITDRAACTAHAPYSATPNLITEVKKRGLSQGKIFSIHVAESLHEVEFLRSGTGSFVDFLKERNVWDNSFDVPGMGSVHYLESLGVLDDRTICVHAVHVDTEEIDILAAKHVKICLCPGSNRFIGVGKPPVTEYVARGILPALGTDSRASNGSLSMWREMSLLREDHPELSPGTVFSMATRGGAEAWRIDKRLGSLEPGKQARVISIPCHNDEISGTDIFEYLTTIGESAKVDWVE